MLVCRREIKTRIVSAEHSKHVHRSSGQVQEEQYVYNLHVYFVQIDAAMSGNHHRSTMNTLESVTL